MQEVYEYSIVQHHCITNDDTVLMLNNRVTINRYDKQSDDQLYTGDEILSVNGMALQGMSHR